MLRFFLQAIVNKEIKFKPSIGGRGLLFLSFNFQIPKANPYFALGSGVKISSFIDRGRAIYKFLIAFLIYMIGGFPTLVYALPQGGTIASGAGTIDTSGSSLTVSQTTNKIIINWESFSIGNNESVIFLQPDSSSSALLIVDTHIDNLDDIHDF